MELEKFQSIVTKYNIDEYNNPVAVTKTEEQQVNPLKNLIQTGIIDELQGFTILNKTMYEVPNYDDIQNANQYWVDYANGKVYFHSSLQGAAIKYRYGDLGNDLISATRIFTKLDDKGNVVEILSDLIDSLIEKVNEYIAILGTFEEATVIINKLAQSIETAKQTKTDLDQSIANAQDDIGRIEAAGNVEILVQGTDWKLNGDIYEKEITHDLYSENLHITAKDTTTKSACTIGWQILDKTRILFKSDNAISMSLTLSASYYKATQTISDDIASEVVKARGSYASLSDNLVRKINYENFTGTTIN